MAGYDVNEVAVEKARALIAAWHLGLTVGATRRRPARRSAGIA